MQQDSPLKTIVVAALLCVVCSVLVSTAAVKLKPIQTLNAKLDVQKKLLLTAGLLDNPRAKAEEVSKAFEAVEIKIVDLQSGDEVTADWDIESFDALKAAKDPRLGLIIAPEKDLAQIKRRSKYAKVYLVRRDGELDQLVLPIRGKGLWSTLYGFIALEKDTRTVRGFGFYAHGETPGLGGEVDNPNWKAQWKGKLVLDETFKTAINVIKGRVDPNHSQAQYQIDGLSGATITSNGVEALVHYWLGEEGFGPYLAKVRASGGSL